MRKTYLILWLVTLPVMADMFGLSSTSSSAVTEESLSTVNTSILRGNSVLDRIGETRAIKAVDVDEMPVDAFGPNQAVYDFSSSFGHTFETVFKDLPSGDLIFESSMATTVSPYLDPEALRGYLDIPGFLPK